MSNFTVSPLSQLTDTIPPFPVGIAYPSIVNKPNLYSVDIPGREIQIFRDSTGKYIRRQYWLGIPMGIPYVMSFEEYIDLNFKKSIQKNWRQIIQQTDLEADEGNDILDFEFDIPGDEESAFATIFGKNEVSIEVNGVANLNIGASIQKNENPRIPANRQLQVDPMFNQNLQLNIRGTIGDKLSIRTNWNTEAAFDFQNRVNIVYDGYDNEILQRLELGNVAITTNNSLIRGGSALFGIKGVVQLGALRVTSIVSQQKGQRNTQVITGGATEQKISLRPADYEYDQHFFIAFYTRQQFEENMSDPQNIGQALQLVEVNIWRLRESSTGNTGQHKAIALAGLGVVQNPDGSYAPPNSQLDAFPDALLDTFRDPSRGVSADVFNVPTSQMVEGYFVPLTEGVDYTLNRALGYINLTQPLGARQALAISFKYVDSQTGEVVSVGDESQNGSDRIYLKLIRPRTVTTENPLWILMMKNIYSLGVQNVNQEGLNIEIKYTEGNIPQSSLPQRSNILLQDLGLDRVDQQGAPRPDNAIDFSTGTLNVADGLIIFPYLQPFGKRIQTLLAQTGLTQDVINKIVFDELYDVKKQIAQQKSKNNYYLIEGSSKGSIPESYTLGFSPVEGSVKVYANGVLLQEGTDYIVDYSIGNVTILDEKYLQKGQTIRIEYENNQLVQIEQKTFTGIQAEYALSDNINIGATYFRLKEKPIQNKIRIGNEPINNTMIGLDINAQFDLPWLTRLIDHIPLIDTRALSYINLSGEFAQLRPAVARTNAVEKAIEQGRLFPDEERGVSFIADFEGADIELSFMEPSRWHLAAAPAAVPGYAPDAPYFEPSSPRIPNTTLSAKIARSDLRSEFAWYSLPRNIVDILGNVQRTPETQVVHVTDVFPNRDVLSEENVITTLDIWYNPTDRGVYNYNDQLKNLLNNEPGRTWGGFVATIPPGQEDFTQNNIQFLEFWVQPILPNGQTPTGQDIEDYDGKIYIDIGLVSEDVIPNYKMNTEDGLARRPEDLQIDNLQGQARSYIPVPPPVPEGQFSTNLREKSDVGLDGAPNTGGFNQKNEHTLFSSFIQSVMASYGVSSTMYQRVSEDPSNDDYTYYGSSALNGLPLQKRFYQLYGHTDGNTPVNTENSRALTSQPNTEGLINPSNVQLTNAYFQYEIEFNPANFDRLNPGTPGTFIINKIEGDRQSDRWYKIRIPLDEWTRKIGGINDFQNISYIRFWLSGYEKPFTLRFATFQLVGSQWRQATNVNNNQNHPASFRIASVNIEEDSRRIPVPYRLPKGVIRGVNRSGQRRTIANEQSLVLEVQNLAPQELNMIKRVYPSGFNMLNYAHVRMYVHGEGFDERGDLELVVRFGTDLRHNYYEYRQPITPTNPQYQFSDAPLSEIPDAQRREEARQVWLYNKNNMDIVLSAFNQLKQLRSQQGIPVDERYVRSDLLPEAPAGARLAIKGNPSLDRINEIGLGVVNPFDPSNPEAGGAPSIDAQVWFNELRVSGYDNRNGWAVNGKVQLQLSDLATVNFNISRQTDGFGSLTSRLGQRRTSDELSYNLFSTIYLDSFIPKKYGWNIPVSFSASRSLLTPRYLPNQGDISFNDFKRSVKARDDITEEEKQQIINQQKVASQTYVENYSFSLVNVSKYDSETLFGKYFLDNTTLDFSYNTTYRHNPQYRLQKNWNYSGSVLYDINFNQIAQFHPFNFLKEVPLLHILSGLQLGYTPASITASFGVNRRYNVKRRRTLGGSETIAGSTPEPLQQFHEFTYNTLFGFTYNLTPSIHTSFKSRSVFDLSRAGIRDVGLAGTASENRFEVVPSFTVLKNVIADTSSPRRVNYEEMYATSWQPRLNKIDALNWIGYSANYSGGYQWHNSSLGSDLGATVSNNFLLGQTINFDIQDWLNGMTWYQELITEEGDKPLHTLADIGQEVLQALLSVQSVDVSFNISTRSLQTGYAGSSQFFNMFMGSRFSPSFAYRTGFLTHIGMNRLIMNNKLNTAIQLPSNRSLNDNLTIDAGFMPLGDLTIHLTWNTQWNKTYSRNITLRPDETKSIVRSQQGMVASSVWAFGSGYATVFRKQLAIAFQDMVTGETVISDELGNQDGRSVLGKRTLQNTFREAYLGIGTATLGERNFMAFPLPGWQITWSGLENYIPFIGDDIAQASLVHSYSGLYRLSYLFNTDPTTLPGLSLGRYTILNTQPVYEPTTINIEKIYAPLIGLNLTWKSSLRTNLQFDYTKLTSLSLSNATIIEHYSKGIRFTLGYTLRNFNLPFFSEIENAIDVTINAAYIEDTQIKYMLSADLDNVFEQTQLVKNPALYDFTSSFTSGQTRVNASLIIGYQFSQTIKANFEYTFRKLIPQSTGVFPRTDHDILFNIIVAIRSE